MYFDEVLQNKHFSVFSGLSTPVNQLIIQLFLIWSGYVNTKMCRRSYRTHLRSAGVWFQKFLLMVLVSRLMEKHNTDFRTLKFWIPLTWMVMMPIFRICRMSFQGLRPLAWYFSHGLMKKYLRFLLSFSTAKLCLIALGFPVELLMSNEAWWDMFAVLVLWRCVWKCWGSFKLFQRPSTQTGKARSDHIWF